MYQAQSRTIWKVQRDDGTVLARHDSKPKAVAAALRFSADGSSYSVVEDLSSVDGTAKGESARLLDIRRRYVDGE